MSSDDRIGKLALVEWLDSCGDAESSWAPVEDRPKMPVLVHSMGILTQLNDDAVVVVPHRIVDCNEAGAQEWGEIIIPIQCVLSVIELVKGEELMDE